MKPIYQPQFIVTKKFTSGPLKGLTVSERTSIRFIVGRRYTGIAGSSNYVVTNYIPWSGVAERKVAAADAKKNQNLEVRSKS